MKKLANTIENKAKIEALKTIKQTQWTGEVSHPTVQECLTALNLFAGVNSGWYNPSAVRIAGLTGIFMINEDGSLFIESRVIKTDNGFKIEHMSNSAYNSFEEKYFEIIDNA